MLGAAFACSAADVPAWSAALEISNGELFLEVFGRGAGARFANVILALSVIGNVAPTFYSFGLSIMTLPIPRLHAVPRFLFPLLATAITMPLAIVGASRFATTLSNFLAVLGYWSVLYVAVLIVEHYVIRRGDYDSYNAEAWASPRLLPTGLAALAAGILSLGLQIPFYDQTLFTGPLAERSGDLGFEVVRLPLCPSSLHLADICSIRASSSAPSSTSRCASSISASSAAKRPACAHLLSSPGNRCSPRRLAQVYIRRADTCVSRPRAKVSQLRVTKRPPTCHCLPHLHAHQLLDLTPTLAHLRHRRSMQYLICFMPFAWLPA